MDLATGQILRDRYRIVNKLAQGGFGSVYRAWDMNLRSHCAVKENLSTSEAVREQFMREAKILSQLTHPHLPRVTDYFFIPEQGQYLVMDYIEGMDLQQMLDAKDEPLPQNKAMEWIYQVCDAIMYLHTQKPPIIHRDIKPANIKVTPDGRAVLVDFGIAKVFDEKSQTVVGAKAVTPGFSPPEQYGKGSTDVRSDVYSLGATLYALLTGEAPPSSVDVISKIVPPPQPPRMRNPAIPPQISDAIVKAMQMEKQARFASVAAFRDELAKPAPALAYGDASTVVAPQVVQPVPAGALVDKQKPKKRSNLPLIIIAVIAGFVLIAAILIGGFWLGNSGILDSGGGQANSTQTAEWLALGFTQTVQAHQESVHATETAMFESMKPTNTSIPEEPVVEPEVGESPTSQPSETPEEEAETGDESARVSERDGMTMLLVPAGEFSMGSDGSDSLANARPEHTVYLDDFWIDETEVTNKMYLDCVQAGGCSQLIKDTIPVWPTVINYYGFSDFSNHPVIFVTWEDAQDYCKWAGRRLPTEAEWEKAARGTEGWNYSWGDGEPNCSIAHYWGYDYYDTFDARLGGPIGCGEAPAEVGTHPEGASVYGAQDMIANVGEWVADWYNSDYYTQAPSENPTGPSSGDFRIYRGSLGYYRTGSDADWFRVSGHAYDYKDFTFTLTVFYRAFGSPRYRSHDLGFRCAFSE